RPAGLPGIRGPARRRGGPGHTGPILGQFSGEDLTGLLHAFPSVRLVDGEAVRDLPVTAPGEMADHGCARAFRQGFERRAEDLADLFLEVGAFGVSLGSGVEYGRVGQAVRADLFEALLAPPAALPVQAHAGVERQAQDPAAQVVHPFE